MKLVRYGRAGAEKPGLIDAEGHLRDLSRIVRDITPETLTPAGLKRLRAAAPGRLPLVKGKPRLGCPLAGIGKIVCIGLNYTDHAEEVKMALPKEPTIFIKANSAISGPSDPIARPRGAAKLDYEVELVAVIGRAALDVEEAGALRHVAAYCLMNDVSEREFQMEHGGGTTKGKSCDTFAPIGPWLVRGRGATLRPWVWTSRRGAPRADGQLISRAARGYVSAMSCGRATSSPPGPRRRRPA
jgi:2-keto-4-pentenoate hydratase/2-oxohepta-3-ene-1,7-dioic acid hydratase in catechol pathway